MGIGIVGLIYMDNKISEDDLFHLKGHNKEFIDIVGRLGAKVTRSMTSISRK